MSYTPPDFIHDYANRMAPLTRRQMPVFAQVGKGLKGDSFSIELEEAGTEVNLVGKYISSEDDTVETEWSYDLGKLFPRIHYELWEGTREINGVLCWCYWIIYRCTIQYDETTVVLWEMTTPYVKMYEYMGGGGDEDTKIDEG